MNAAREFFDALVAAASTDKTEAVVTDLAPKYEGFKLVAGLNDEDAVREGEPLVVRLTEEEHREIFPEKYDQSSPGYTELHVDPGHDLSPAGINAERDI